MMKQKISQYIFTLFEESRDGAMMAGDADERIEYSVEWDAQTAEHLAQECGDLIACLTELAGQYEKLKCETRHLTQAQMQAWNTYLRPFPDHGLDMEALQVVWEKMDTPESVTKEEYALAEQYDCWFEENALQRLPVKRCDPIPLIGRARRYGKLVELNAPTVVLENEAKCFAEEYVLYHCMTQNAPKQFE